MWSKTPKLSKTQLETITSRTPVYYGYPEGPAKGMNRLRTVGSASEKEQIVLNNGYQTLLAKMFPVMDMVQRNSLALQEMIMEKTMTSERMAKADDGIGLSVVDCAELQLQSFQTNMLMTHMRHEFHNAIGKQYRDATKLTGQLNQMAACEHGDIGLGAGSSSEMEQLKAFSNEKRKQDFRTGAGPMAIGPVLPTTNATSLVVVAVVAAADSDSQVVVAVTTIETATATSGVADIEEATEANLPASTETKRQGTRTARRSTRITRAIWLTTSRIFAQGRRARAYLTEGNAESSAPERLEEAAAEEAAAPTGDAPDVPGSPCPGTRRFGTAGSPSTQRVLGSVQALYRAAARSTNDRLRRVAATLVGTRTKVGKERAAGDRQDDRRIDEGSDRRPLVATRAPTRAPTTGLSTQSVGQSDSSGHQVLPDANTTSRQDTKPPSRRARSKNASADGEALDRGWSDRADLASEVARIQGQETKTVLSAFVLNPEEWQVRRLLLGGRDHRRQLLARVPQRQAAESLPAAWALQGAQLQDLRRRSDSDAGRRRHVHDLHRRVGGVYDAGSLGGAPRARRPVEQRDEQTVGQHIVTRPRLFRHQGPGVRDHSTARISNRHVNVRLLTEPFQLAEGIQPGPRLLDPARRGLHRHGDGRQHGGRDASHQQGTGGDQCDQAPEDSCRRTRLFRDSSVAEGCEGNIPDDGAKIQRHPLRLGPSAEVDRRLEASEHLEIDAVPAAATPAEKASVSEAGGDVHRQGRSSERHAVWSKVLHEPAATQSDAHSGWRDDLRPHGLPAGAGSATAGVADQHGTPRAERHDDGPREARRLQGHDGLLGSRAGRGTAANEAGTGPTGNIHQASTKMEKRVERIGRNVRRRSHGHGALAMGQIEIEIVFVL